MAFWEKGRREESGFDFLLIKKTLRINVDVDVDVGVDDCFALFLVPRYLIYLYLGNGRS